MRARNEAAGREADGFFAFRGAYSLASCAARSDQSSCMKTTTKRAKRNATQPTYEAAYAECAAIAERLPRLLADHKNEIRTAGPADPAHTEDLIAAQDHLRCALDALGDVAAIETQPEATVLRALKRIASRIEDRRARVHIAAAIQEVEDWRNGKD
jgi:hypothetical protein